MKVKDNGYRENLINNTDKEDKVQCKKTFVNNDGHKNWAKHYINNLHEPPKA